MYSREPRLREQGEGVDVPGADDEEVASVEGGDAPFAVAFRQGDQAGVRAPQT